MKPAIFLVCSAEHITFYGGEWEPPELGRDVVYVVTHSKARARVLAVRWFRRRGARYLRDADNPFTGMQVIRLEPCACGRALAGGKHMEHCPEMQRVWDAEDEAEATLHRALKP